jgi:hypothetical protein
MRTRTTMRNLWILCVTLSLLAALVTACGGGEGEAKEVSDRHAIAQEDEAGEVVEKETVVETVVEEVVVEAMPDAAEKPSVEEGESAGREPSAAGPIPDFQPQATQRLIIKDANLDLEVENTDRAIDGTTQVAGDLQGYIISHRVWYENQAKYATITIAVPVQEFENALRRLRGLAWRVLNESASGEDVTDQYVDLQSRLRNLEATRDRIRSFLDQAKTIEESLEVNRQLSEMEDQIEQVKGRLNFLRDRAAFSTITVNLNPILPTPTPTPTPTVTPTPTPTVTPTPDVWRPGETAKEALDVTVTIGQGLTELLIWFVIVPLPFLLIFAVLYWVTVRLARRFGLKRTVTTPPPTEEQADEGEV